MMKFITESFSCRGGRNYNEDSLYVHSANGRLLAIVADGLGMHGGGDIASAAAVEALKRACRESAALEKENLLRCFQEANQAVCEKQTAACQMKSTAVMLLCQDGRNRQSGRAAIAHIGDSRGYYFAQGRLAYQTTDHSVSQMAVLQGEITPAQIRFHEDRSRLLRALGADTTVRPEIMLLAQPVKQGDVFLLCSDGFWEYIDETEMEIDLTKSGNPAAWLSYMAARVGRRIDGRHDNLSAVAVFVTE